MRNRGVEICILDQNKQISNDYDIKSLVQHQGIQDYDLVERIIKIINTNELICGKLFLIFLMIRLQ